MAQKNFKSSDEIYSWLCGYINYERGLPPSKSFRLDRMEILSEMAGHPERCSPVVHIAGSKGKGSVTVMAASMLEAAGKKAARYMSPHVNDFRERISLGNVFFGEGIYCAAANELRYLAEHTLPSAKISLFDPESDEGEALTFFELMTMLFFLCARTEGCDAMVVETGMGGRLDCTNIVDPAVSVITLIELEHTAVLGKTITEIAGEKAGIIKQGRPLVLARQNTEALEKISGIAAEKGSTLFYFPEFASVENINVHKNGTDFSMMLDLPNAFSWKPVANTFSIPVPGSVQAENAALAATALSLAFPGIKEKAIKSGLKKSYLPGRFEKIAKNKAGCDIILDGAHTPGSIAPCAETFCLLYGRQGILLFGCAADKNAGAMAQLLIPFFSQIIITAPGNFKLSDPEKTFNAFVYAAHYRKQRKDAVLLIKDTSMAIDCALRLSREKCQPVLCTGSFYLVSEIRRILGACRI